MANATFVTTTLAVITGAGVTQQIKVAKMPDGGLAPAHAFVDASGTLLGPASDATVTTGTQAIVAATQAFASAS